MIDQTQTKYWGGVSFGRFFLTDAFNNNDYDHLCWIIEGTYPADILKVQSNSGEVIVITAPIPTIIKSIEKIYYIIQMECSNSDNPFDLIGIEQIQSIDFDRNISVTFETPGGRFSIFDAADIGDDLDRGQISFELEAGLYRISSANYSTEQETDCIIHQIASDKM